MIGREDDRAFEALQLLLPFHSDPREKACERQDERRQRDTANHPRRQRSVPVGEFQSLCGCHFPLRSVLDERAQLPDVVSAGKHLLIQPRLKRIFEGDHELNPLE